MLQKTAEIKNDKSILVHIRGKDCVAIEAKYHRKCYQIYTKGVFNMANAKQDVEPSGYDKAFDVFCTQIIDKRIIGNKEIMMLSYLNQRFIEYVRKFADTAVTYQAIRLKKRIQSRYPQIVFHA